MPSIGMFGNPSAGMFGAPADVGMFGQPDAALYSEMLARAEAEKPGMGAKLAEWYRNSTFVRPAVEGVKSALTLPGDVYSGAQPTMAFDPLTGETGTNPALADRAAELAGTMTLGAGAVPAEANALRMGIKAYHGSPHDFDQFSMDKIGTGEGAQAYGHGLYFAENEGVAKSYKNAGPASNAQYDEINARMSELARTMGADAIPGRGREFRSDVGRKAAEEYDALMKKRTNLGSTYEVDIAADPEHFLDWDKPLSEQPRGVTDNLRELATRYGMIDPVESGRSLMAFMSDLSHKSIAGSESKATELLRQAGVPGIRYLDQGSRPQRDMEAVRSRIKDLRAALDGDTGFMTEVERGEFQAQFDRLTDELHKAENPTSNYVIFDQELVTILKKYGLPITAGGVAALSQLAPEEARAAQSSPSRGGGW